ncbi:hypothetical protein D3C78_1342900 [compost metagenome]
MNKGNRLAAVTFYRRGGGYAGALELNVAAVAWIHPGQHFDQRRFAGAIFAQQGQDFARHHLQTDVVYRDVAAKALNDMAEG